GSNESSPGMTLSVATYKSPSGTTTPIPQPPSNIPSYRTSFFDNANELERGGTPNRIPQRVTFNTTSTLSSNQSSRPSNLRITTLSVGNINSGNPSITSSFTTANWQPVNNRWLKSNSSNRRNNTMGHQNVTTKGIPQSTTPILIPQPAIVPVGENNDNAYPKGRNQDPVEWLEAFERACKANRINTTQMIEIVSSYLTGIALT
ncbi:11620_t:CDS:2, partial [Funneliformis caledonium]